MFSIPEQISAITKTSLANPLSVFNALSKTVFGGMEKIIALNINTAKQSFESSTTTARSLFSANLAQDLFSRQPAKAQPQIEKIAAYGHELAAISAQTRDEFMSALTTSQALFSTTVSQQTTKPLVAISAVKEEKKLSVKPEAQVHTQLALLTEPEVKVVKKVAQKSKAKPVVSKTSVVTSPVEIKTSKVMPTANKKIADNKTVELKTIEATPAAKSLSKDVSTQVSKPVTKAIHTKSDVVKPEIIARTETSTTPESPVEKKSAVKMPFPASPAKKNAKPTFPTVSARPTYKAKGSAATGAKKPVRQ